VRQALFAIVLVAASFAGGAVINGPGLRWVRDLVLKPPGTEIATTTLDDPAANPAAGVAPVAEIPSAPIPPLVVAPGSPESPETATAPAARAPTPEPPRPPAPEPPRRPELTAAPVPEATRTPPEAGAGAPIPLPSTSSPALVSEPPPAPAPVDRDVAQAALSQDSGPPRLETQPDPPTAPAPASAPAPPSAAPGSDDWGTIRQKMRTLGVARYGIEGAPDGRVRFHCVIPLAGRRAVSQQFEAEGDDALDAAQTALRRVALWRATEQPHPASAAPPAPAP
jgi:hypothetical protein